MTEHEQKVRFALRLTAIFVVAWAISLFVSVACAFAWQVQPIKVCFILGGSTMTIAALLAQNRHSHFVALLTPNTFATSEFVDTLLKYQRFKSIGSWVFLSLGIVGALFALCGSHLG